MHVRKTIWLLASCAALAGCGGGGSTSSGPTVVGGAPTPSPSSSPTPTPTALNTGEVKPGAGATFIAASMELNTTGGVSETNGIITGGMTNSRVTTFDTPMFSGAYSATAGYHLSDAVNAAVFGPSQLTFDSTRPNGNGVVLFTNLAAAEDYLALYQQSTYTSSVKGSGYTTAQYGGTAGWQHTVVSGSSRHTRLDYFAYGSATPVGAMPHSGVVTFSMLGSGNYATDTNLWFLSSDSGNTITVDFAAGTVSGKLGLAGQNFYKNVVGGIGYIPLNGSFTGNGMTISFADASLDTASAVRGQFHLLFVGPNANELIVTYVANDGTQAAVGAAIGVIEPFRN